mmetsp:Transcript_8178/g.13212  ORF Transcript_8178/g.13212 Transcript_8178/m.13212 type:complete len:98 (+) Transcript_8178:79-372(+)
MGKGGWYEGKVDVVNEDGTVNISYDDGDRENNVQPGNAIPVNTPIIPNGTRVQVRFRGKVKFYPAVVAGYSEGFYKVQYDDGDSDDSVLRGWIRVYQ